MIIKDQKVLIKWNNTVKKKYELKGYIFTGNNQLFEVNVLDLSIGSSIKIKCSCDYCNKLLLIPFKKAIKEDIHACKDCARKKVKQNNLAKYGVTNTSKLQNVKEKTKNTNLIKYGVSNPQQNKEIKQKTKQTNIKKYGNACSMNNLDIREKIKQDNLQKYGVECFTQTEEFKHKYKQTSLNKYGVDHPFKSQEIKNKIKQTFESHYGVDHNMKSEKGLKAWKDGNIKKYGVDNPWKSEDVKLKIRNSLYQNGSGPSSKNQRYLCSLLCGQLNYPINWYSLDIAFPNEKIYIEYDGSGHDLQVKLGYIDEKEFRKKEISRKLYLEKKGWKLIRIISKYDKLLLDTEIIQIYNRAIDYLKNTIHTWVEVDIDQNEYRCAEYVEKIFKQF